VLTAFEAVFWLGASESSFGDLGGRFEVVLAVVMAFFFMFLSVFKSLYVIVVDNNRITTTTTTMD
jgi:hypothetical protein